MYPLLFSLLRRLDPEFTHRAGMVVLRGMGVPGLRQLVRGFSRVDDSFAVDAMGLHFSSPLGLAAGFDKDAEAITGLGALGFGHIEVGTVTPRPQPGNPRPRLFRLPEDRALINRMGFNNHGSAALRERLVAARRRDSRPVIGVNIGKNRDTPLQSAVDDYRQLAHELHDVADYLVVNVSSPNTPGLRSLHESSELAPLLEAVVGHSGDTPVLVKVSPDASDEQLRDICAVVTDLGLAGVVATNTSISRESLVSPADLVARSGEGGVSGAPLATRSREALGVVRDALGDDACVISVGGVFTGADVRERLDDGATLVQAYTAFVYRGPALPRLISRELQALAD